MIETHLGNVSRCNVGGERIADLLGGCGGVNRVMEVKLTHRSVGVCGAMGRGGGGDASSSSPRKPMDVGEERERSTCFPKCLVSVVAEKGEVLVR